MHCFMDCALYVLYCISLLFYFSPLSVHIPYSVQLVCHNTPSAAVYNVNEMQYNNCTPPSTLSKYQIGKYTKSKVQ